MNNSNELEIEKIKETVQYYVDAVTKINPDLVKKAWHDDGRRIFVDNNEQVIFLHNPTKDNIEKIKEALKQTQQSCIIENIDIC